MEDQVKRVEKLAAIGEMASGLAHEIKNPLASLSGSIQFLREDIPYDPDRDRFNGYHIAGGGSSQRARE